MFGFSSGGNASGGGFVAHSLGQNLVDYGDGGIWVGQSGIGDTNIGGDVSAGGGTNSQKIDFTMPNFNKGGAGGNLMMLSNDAQDFAAYANSLNHNQNTMKLSGPSDLPSGITMDDLLNPGAGSGMTSTVTTSSSSSSSHKGLLLVLL